MRRFILGALPKSTELKPAERRVLVLSFAVLLVGVAVTAANAVFGVGGKGLVGLIREWLSCVVYILVAAIVALRAIRSTTHRRSWALFAGGFALYGLGNVLWSFWIGNLPNPPIPSFSDGLWLSLYPLSYAGIVGFARVGGQRSRRRECGWTASSPEQGWRQWARCWCSVRCSPRRRAVPWRWRPSSRTRSATSCSRRWWSACSRCADGAST